MPAMTQYTCQPEVLMMVEAALAANGYTLEPPVRKQSDGATCVVMTQGAAVVLLIDSARQEAAEIEVWGEARSAAIQLLESLPISLSKQSQSSTPARRGVRVYGQRYTSSALDPVEPAVGRE